MQASSHSGKSTCWLYFLAVSTGQNEMYVVLKQFKWNILIILPRNITGHREVTAIFLATFKNVNVGMCLDIYQLI